MNAILRTLTLPTIAITFALLVVGLRTFESDAEPTDAENIDKGLSDVERFALHQELFSESMSSQEAAARDFFERGGNPRALRRVERLSITFEPPSNLAEAIERSALVVRGRVSEVDFLQEDYSGSRVMFRVEQVLAGEVSTGDVLEIQHPGDIEIDPSDGSLVLTSAAFSPVVFEGDDLLLMLVPVVGSERYYVLEWAGQMYVDATDRLKALDGNAFGTEVDGVSIDEFAAHLARVKE